MLGRESVEKLLDDPAIDSELRRKLELVQEVREYSRSLGLEVEDQYTSYVDWPGDRIITTVVATPPGEITPHEFSFPIVGRVPYKGFFEKERAEREAESLRAKGMDVCLFAVKAYSTLGWFPDPLTTPMLGMSTDRLAETVIHELVHTTVFVESQPDFNEGAANFVGEEAAIRFFARRSSPEARPPDHDLELRVGDDRLIASELMRLRDEVSELYAGPLQGETRARKREAMTTRTRERVGALPLRTRDSARLAEKVRLGDACLSLSGTYVADTPKHELVLEHLGGDLNRFIERLREAAEAEDPRKSFFALSL
jgi:predicted aminopeptidase